MRSIPWWYLLLVLRFGLLFLIVSRLVLKIWWCFMIWCFILFTLLICMDYFGFSSLAWLNEKGKLRKKKWWIIPLVGLFSPLNIHLPTAYSSRKVPSKTTIYFFSDHKYPSTQSFTSRQFAYHLDNLELTMLRVTKTTTIPNAVGPVSPFAATIHHHWSITSPLKITTYLNCSIRWIATAGQYRRWSCFGPPRFSPKHQPRTVPKGEAELLITQFSSYTY